MKARTILIWAFILTLSGCIPSLYPIYTENDLVFDARLLGSWADEDGTEWYFETIGRKQLYLLKDHVIRMVPNPMKRISFKLEHYQFLDLFPDHDMREASINSLGQLRSCTYIRTTWNGIMGNQLLEYLTMIG